MKVARSMFSALFLSILVSACAQGAAGNRSPLEYQFSSVEPSRASSVVEPLAEVNHIWTAQLADRPVAR